ncbi:hypothetical protein BC830DRAFT_1140700 [Chytriomyces sp. MP71]|nr:hypothetical protein BC830DRAFT_1140700 [Chytriomyces sp. MP71]
MDPTALKTTSLCTLVLLIKWYMTVSIQGNTRFRAGSRSPEDALFSNAMGVPDVEQNFGVHQETRESNAVKEEARWQRILANDIENIPLGLLIAWSSLSTAKAPGVHVAAIVLFTVARIIYTVMYAHSLQPHRSIAWTLATAAVLVLSVNGVIGAFSF